MTFTEIKERIAQTQSYLDAIRKGGSDEDYYPERLASTNEAQDCYELAVAVYNNTKDKDEIIDAIYILANAILEMSEQ